MPRPVVSTAWIEYSECLESNQPTEIRTLGKEGTMTNRLQNTICAILMIAFALMLSSSSMSEEISPSTGLLVSVEGEAVVHRGEGAETAVEGLVLQEGDTLIVKMGGRCTGFTPTGEHFDLKGPAELVLTVGSDKSRGSGVSSWIRLQLAQWIGQSRRQPLTTRTVRDWDTHVEAPSPIIPAPGGRVRSSKPRFVWSTIPGIDRYVVTVAPASGDEIVQMVRGSSMMFNELVAGAEYVWKVHPAQDGWEGESTWRSFTTMTADEERELDAALKDLKDLEAGVLLLSAGLHEEAVYRFDAAIASGLHEASARLWRAQALAKVGLYRQAYEDVIKGRGVE
jgi:hypothetical protein